MGNQQVTDLAWLAGFVDGEGSIGVHFIRAQGTYRPCFEVCSVNGHAIERVVSIASSLGVNLHIVQKLPSERSRYNVWIARTTQFAGVEKILASLEPYLTIKQPHARLTLRFVRSRQDKGVGGRGKTRQIPYSDFEKRTVEEIQALNAKKGNPNDYTRDAKSEDIV